MDVRAFISIILVLGLFFLSSYLVQRYIVFFKNYLDFGIFGMAIYVMLAFLGTIFAPISNLSIVPIASNIWGWPIAGLLNVIGWFSASIVVFILSRKYGTKIIKKFVSLDDLLRLESFISEKNHFWAAVIARSFAPIDAISSVFGLFSKISFSSYALASFIGIIPYAFIVSYAGLLNLLTQIILAIIGAIILIVFWILKSPKIKFFRKHKD